jgi:nicotinate-nucleotide pyrophosphorylase (carboxylating)
MVVLDYLLQFIEEDAPSGDITSAAIIPDITCNAVIKAEQDGIIAGIDEASILFSHFDVNVTRVVKDGDSVCHSTSILLLTGDAKKILLVERTALNIIGRMSGIATQTRKIVDIVSAVNPRCRSEERRVGKECS